MLSINEAKARTRILKTFLKEQNVELSHGVVLEAIARLDHHKSWAAYLAAAKATSSLVRTLADVKDWPTFVFCLDEREENDFREEFYVFPAGTTLDTCEVSRFGGRIDNQVALEVPDGFVFNGKVVVVSVYAAVPAIDKYGMPHYGDERAASFFREELGCAAIDGVETSLHDTGDDSASMYWFEARVEPGYAKLLMQSAPVVAPAAPTEDELTKRAYEKVFLRVFTDTNNQPYNVIMDALQQRSKDSVANGEAFLQFKVDELIALNGPYELLSCKDLYARLKSLAKSEFERLVVSGTARTK